MKKFSKIFITLTVVATLFLCPLSTFAYSGNTNNGHYPMIWDEAPIFTIFDTSGKSIVDANTTFDSIHNRYNFNFSQNYNDVYMLELKNRNSQLNFNLVPELYDYYVLATVNGYNATSSTFSYVPLNVKLRCRNCNAEFHDHFLQDLKVYHNDDYNSTGFTVFGKVPDDFVNTSIFTIVFYNKYYGSIPANLSFEGLIIAVDKGSDISGLTGILNSINSNTESTSNKLTQINNVLNMYGDTNFNKIDKSEDKSTIEDLNDAESELIGDTSDYEDRLDITINPTATKVVWDSVDTFVKGNGKVFAMFITLLSLGFIKLVLNR